MVSRYDTDGLRYEIEENEKLSRFIFNRNGDILAETDKEDNVVSRFVRGYEIVAADVLGEANRCYYSIDEQGSTSLITDSDGLVKNEYWYDAFGNILSSKEDIHNRITYTGQQFDGITNQYYLRARFYNPVIGRFTQEDVYRGDGLNLYAYCSNNPVVYYDPSGYKPDCTGKGNNRESKDNNSSKSSVPEFEVSRSEYPNHAKMLENAQSEGHSLEGLERGEGTRAARKNRYESQKEIRKKQGGPPKGYDYDEFPYASTKQGGKGAHVEPVPSVENQAVGRDLGQFYRKYNIKCGDKFNIKIVD